MNHYLENMPMLARQWSRENYKDTNRQRLYLKDIDCPSIWRDKLKEQIPQSVYYLNDSTGEIGGPGAVPEATGKGIGKKMGRGIARAGDLMACLPPRMRAENLMCYIGHEGTYTPAHREMCASLGQNMMVETSGTMGEDGKPTKPGSSLWFMTESKDRHLVSEYWLSVLGHDMELEAHFAQINAWKRAPFVVYVVEQKLGDFILVPPLAPHQVWNRGTRTMKVAWNRTTVETLEMALDEALPKTRLACRDEQYKNKAIVLFALNKYSGLLKTVDKMKAAASDEAELKGLTNGLKIRQLQKDFKRLFPLFTRILLAERFSPKHPEKHIEYLPYDSYITCSYCRANIFNRFLTCKSCVIPLEDGEEDTFDVCMDCYAMGRSCRCLSKLQWCEQFPWKDLLEKHDIWRSQIIRIDGGLKPDSPMSLDIERELSKEKTIAEICQEQLKIRPWRDPAKDEISEASPDSIEDEDDLNADGTPKRKKNSKSNKWHKCHICSTKEPKWKMAICECGLAFCYGSLWRAFDLMPQTIMEDPSWKCPRCKKICSCGTCRKDPKIDSYTPKGIFLGYDTRTIADPRAVESLVDFSCSNLHWIKVAGDDTPYDSRILENHAQEAERTKNLDPTLNEEHYVDEDSPDGSDDHEMDDGMFIDPQLRGVGSSTSKPQGRGRAGQIRSTTMKALDAMHDGLSQLERDSQAFMMQAGLTGANGVIYEYPDPETSHGQPPPAAEAEEDDDIPENDEISLSAKKKKKNNKKKPTQKDVLFSSNPANQKFIQTQTQKTMTEAKKTGRLISAKAALRGDSKLIKFKISSSGLSSLNLSQTSNGLSRVEVGGFTPVNVESDLPGFVAPTAVMQISSSAVSKKRIRAEFDDDFETGKRIEDATAQKTSAGRETDSEEDAIGSDDDDAMSTTEDFVPSQNPTTPKRRSLPAYLARRSPVDTSELPKELDFTVRIKVRKTKPMFAMSSQSITQNDGNSSVDAATPPEAPEETEEARIAREAREEEAAVAKAKAAREAEETRAERARILEEVRKANAKAAAEELEREKAREAERQAEVARQAKLRAATQRAEENRRAKMRAAESAESESEISSSDDSLVAASSAKRRKLDEATSSPKRGRGRPPRLSAAQHSTPVASVNKHGPGRLSRHSTGALPTAFATPTPSVILPASTRAKKSIFASGKKIKITSAK